MTYPNEVFGEWFNYLDDKQLLLYRAKLLDCTLKNIPIEPKPELVFHCFRATKANDLKVVILGQDPYFDGSATGLAFANSADKKELSPSLKIIKDSVLSLSNSEENPKFDQTLESWAKQGILLLNSALTVRRGEPGSHMNAWRPFIERLLVAISAQTNACFLLFGKVAWTFKDCIFDNARGVFMEYHPAYYARNGTQMPNTIWKNMLDYVKENYGTTLKLYE
jgi:uracil-DNA glycosylase